MFDISRAIAYLGPGPHPYYLGYLEVRLGIDMYLPDLLLEPKVKPTVPFVSSFSLPFLSFLFFEGDTIASKS